MRIIAGSRRGKKLTPIRGDRIRPTADHVRESIFNVIAGATEKARVLDLFAGSGALGIEALSRGAGRAVFIDRDPAALAVLTQNLKACRFEHLARVIRWDISRNLNCLRSADVRFDLVFMDPPYGQGLIQPTLSHLLHCGTLAADALIVIEHALTEPVGADPNMYAVVDQRQYRKSLVSFLNCVV